MSTLHGSLISLGDEAMTPMPVKDRCVSILKHEAVRRWRNLLGGLGATRCLAQESLRAATTRATLPLDLVEKPSGLATNWESFDNSIVGII